MEFKMNAIISTSMVIIVMFAFVNCRLINNAADNEEESKQSNIYFFST